MTLNMLKTRTKRTLQSVVYEPAYYVRKGSAHGIPGPRYFSRPFNGWFDCQRSQ